MSIDIKLEFERECYKCYGASRYRTGGNICRPCRNTGFVITELGEALVRFLENNKIREVADEQERESQGEG